MLQAVWVHIKELAGKELDLSIILKFLLLVTPRIVALVLPLTILLASIMMFGQFAENYEFAAMKSTGISLQRAMKTLSVFIVALSIITFFFANNVIPRAEFEFLSLRKNLAKLKPSFAIAEGQFNQLGASVNIKVLEKKGKNKDSLRGVTIHQKEDEKNKSYETTIISKTGHFVSSETSNALKLVLFDGHIYKDILPSKRKLNSIKNDREHLKTKFEKYTLVFDLSELNDVDFEEKSNTIKSTMLGVSGLDKQIDTLKIKNLEAYKSLSKNLTNRSKVSNYASKHRIHKDSIFKETSILHLFNTKQKIDLLNRAINTTKTTLQIFKAKQKSLSIVEKNLNKHVISYYDKFALAFMCIVLFFIGAPLGALIKKGGIGLPIIIAVLLFLAYLFIGLFSKNSAESGNINPVLATWIATIVMFPLSIYFTHRATRDRTILDLGEITEPLVKRFSTPLTLTESNTTALLDSNSDAYVNLKRYPDEKLINFLKNFHQQNVDKRYRNTALALLNERGYSEQELKFGGNLVNSNYVDALRYKSYYSAYAKMSVFLYITYAVIGVTGLILNNNGFPVLGKVLTTVGVIAFIMFITALLKSFINLSNFNKLFGTYRPVIYIVMLILLGIPLYFIYYFVAKHKMNRDLKQVQ